MPLISSTATEGERETYTQGACHVFALALHRAFGWPMQVVMDDRGEPHWENPEDPDDFILQVCHVYALDEAGMAWDVLGVRPETEVALELREDYGLWQGSTDECRNEGELAPHVDGRPEHGDDGIDRPLHAYSEEDVAQAAEVARRVLDSLPGFARVPSP